MLTLKLKVTSPAKTGLFGSSRELQSETCQLQQDGSHIGRTKERSTFIEEGANLGGLFLSTKSVGVNWRSHVSWLLIGWAVGRWKVS